MAEIDRYPMILGAIPLQEAKYREGRALNPRAIEIERTHLYDGQVRAIIINGEPRTVKGFMAIQTGYVAIDQQMMYPPVVRWGLAEVGTRREFGDASPGLDPLHIFRTVNILETHPARIDDWSSTYLDAVGFFCPDWYGECGDGEYQRERAQRLVDSRQRLTQLIGASKLEEIGNTLPLGLEEMIATLRGHRNIWIDYSTIRDEVRQGKLIPSEFLLDGMAESRQQSEDLARGLEESGGAW